MEWLLTNISYKKWTGEFLWLSLDVVKKEWWMKRIKENIIGRELTFVKQESTKTCTWRFDLWSMQSSPCPRQVKLFWSWKNCESCERRTWFSPFFYNQDTLSDAQKKYNATPHLVYLAYFGWEDIKIWITSERRSLARIMEQWALARTILWTYENADQARRIEAIWSTYAWCKEHLHGSRKVKYIDASVVDLDRAQELFSKKIDLISEWGDLTFPQMSIWKNSTYVKYAARLWEPTHNVSKKDRFSWMVLWILWTCLLVEQWPHLMLHNLKSRIGYDIQILDGSEEMSWFVSQASLF